MNITTKLFQSNLFQAVIDHVQCGPLLTYKENTLPAGYKVGDEISDRLTLAGAGWPLDDIAVPGPAFQDGVCLGRIGGYYMEPVIRAASIDTILFKVAGLIAE